MGLDMYLEKMPRYKGTTMRQVRGIEGYFELQKAKLTNKELKNCTLKEWCGIDESELPPQEVINYYMQFNNTKYSYWDDKHQYGRDEIIEQVGYWRKANQIHNWFIENVQGGEDDCDYYDVSREDLKELLDTCNVVLASCKLVEGKVSVGEKYIDGKFVTMYEDGKIIENPNIAQESLPTQGGFFFGGTEYDEWYLESIKDTIEIITKVLDETDFDKEAIYYTSSW